MKTKSTLNYIEKLLADGEYEFQPPKKLEDIKETEEKEIWYKDPLSVKVLTNKANKDNKIVYQNIIKINDKEVYITEISDKKSMIYFFDEVLFLVDDKITSIPLHYILTALLKENPYNHISNGIYKIRKEEDIQFLILNKSELEEIKKHIDKYQNKLNQCIRKDVVYNNIGKFLLVSMVLSLLINQEAFKYIVPVYGTNLLFDLYNYFSIIKSKKKNGQDVGKLVEYQIIYDNMVSYICDKNFKLPDEFSIIKEHKKKTLLQNEYLHLYKSYKQGYVDNNLTHQTSLFLNDIELWQGYKNEEIPIVVFDRCVYILKDEGIAIPFVYILESVYEDNPVDKINEFVENDKVKQLKR